MTILLCADVTFGLMEPSYVVREEQGVISVCVEQKSPENDCGVKFEFNLTISTESGSAGNAECIYYRSNENV